MKLHQLVCSHPLVGEAELVGDREARRFDAVEDREADLALLWRARLGNVPVITVKLLDDLAAAWTRIGTRKRSSTRFGTLSAGPG